MMRIARVGAAAAESPPARAWILVALLWGAFLLNYIDRQIVFSIYPSLKTDVGFSNATLGLIGSVFLWTYSVSSLATGRAADLARKDTVIVLCVLLWSGATIGTALSASAPQFLFWRGVMGVTESLYLPASVAVLSMLHSGRTRSTALALHQTAQMIGIILGGWGGGLMADRFGWRPGFLYLGAAGIAYALLLRSTLPRIGDSPKTRPAAAQEPVAFWRSRCYAALLVAFTAYCLILWMIYAWLPLHLYNRFGLSQAASGLSATLYLQGSTALGVVLWGWLADRLARTRPAARFYIVGCGVFFSAPIAYSVFHLSSLAAVQLACFAFGLAAGGLHSNLSSASCDVVRPERFGSAVGLLNFAGGAAGGLAILMAGLYREALGISTLMAFAALLAMAASAVMLLVVRSRFAVESPAR